MAILQGCPAIKVSIMSNGATLDEYPDEDRQFNHKDLWVPNSRCAMAYIECTSDAEFGIKWEITSDYTSEVPHTHLRFRAFIDGKRIGGDTKRIPESGSWSRVLSETDDRINDVECVQRKLLFKSIKKVDDSDSARVNADIKLANGLGEILVVVHRCNKIPAIPGDADTIIFGPETRVHKPQHHSSAELELTDGSDLPLCVFRFKYRSREALQQELIIPRSLSPDDLIMGPLNPRNQNEANASQSKEERLAQLKREVEMVKSEVKEEDPRSRKRERDGSISRNGGRAYKTIRCNWSDVIDLTNE